MTTKELLNPNLHLTLMVKLACENKYWRRNAAKNADGDSKFLTESLKGALQDAINEVLQRELGKYSTAFADYSCEIVDDDKTPIYYYDWDSDEPPEWCMPEPDFDSTPDMIRRQEKWINGLSWSHCYPISNGDNTHYLLVVLTTPYGDCSWCIYDDNTNEKLDYGEGGEGDCEEAFEKLMKEINK